MVVLFVDLEHERVRRDLVRGRLHRAKLEVARSRLEAAAGEPCGLGVADAVTPARVAEVAPSAVVLSGSTADWAEYDLSGWEGLLAVIQAGEVPILGICAGHQLIGHAHGAPWGPLAPLGQLDGEEAVPDPGVMPALRRRRGFREVAVDPRSPLFAGMGKATVFQSHYWQLEAVPEGFVQRASSAWSPIQAIERVDRPVYGVQFHPERFDDAHPDGARVLRNFFAAARGSAGSSG